MEIAIGWVIRGGTGGCREVQRAADRLHTAGSMRVESPTAARRPLQPPLARVLWCSKVVDEDRKNGFRWSYRKPAGHPTQFPASLVPKYAL